MTFQDSPTLGKFTENVEAISRSIDARQEELKAAYEQIEKLESALRHAQEAIFWHDAGDFEQDGKTIDEVIAEIFP